MKRNESTLRLRLSAAVMVCACMVAALSHRAASAELSGGQRQALKTAESAIGNAESDLKAAAGSAGTAARPATGSRLKLTRMRLNSAAQRLNQAAGLLKDLPADDSGVQALLDRHAAGATLVRQIESILGGGGTAPNASTPGEAGATDTGAASAPKLDYRQEKSLKDARWSLNELEQCCNQAGGIVNRLDGEGEKAVHADVKTALAYVEKGRQRQEYVMNNLGKLPHDHPQVRPVVERTEALKATLGALESRLEAADTELQKLTGMENYPAYDLDFRKLQDLARRYADFDSLVQYPGEFATVIREDGAVLQEVQRIARTYLPLVEQKTDPGAKLERLFAAFQNQRREFAAKLIPYAKELPKKIDGNIDEALKLADQAVANGSPSWFGEGSGIERHFEWAEMDIAVLEGLNEEQGKQAREKLAKARAEMEGKAESLRDQIIEGNELPPDLYAGEDRGDLVKLATAVWRKLEKDAKVLAARIPSQAWKRVTKWQLHNRTFQKIDHSKLQVQLLVDAGDGLAVIRPVNLFKYHLEADTIKAYPMDSPDEMPRPRQVLKADKIR